jgi:hypothetical protein
MIWLLNKKKTGKRYLKYYDAIRHNIKVALTRHAVKETGIRYWKSTRESPLVWPIVPPIVS